MRHKRITIAQHPDFSNRDDGQREPLFSSAGPKFGRGRKQMDGVRSSLAAALILTAGVLSAAGALTWTATALAQSSLPARPGLTTKAPSSLQRPQGTIAGYIFWDDERVAYNPSVPCQDLQVELNAITGTGLQKLATTDQLQPTPTTQHGPGLGLCNYSFTRVPEGVALQVQVAVGGPFTSRVGATGPFGAVGGLIKIPGGQCTDSPSSTTLTSTYLESGWVGCGEHAYNVNFQLVPRNTRATLPPQNTTLLHQSSGTNLPSKPMMLQPNPRPGPPPTPNGMLVPAVRPATGAQSPARPNGALTVTSPVVARSQGLAGPCTGTNLVVSALRFEFTTGKDDLRGGDNNLDVEVHFKDNTFKRTQNVNRGANWPNLSVHRVDIPLDQPVRADQISEIHLVHNAQASFPNSQDNWEMTQLRVFAAGQGKAENIANYGFNDFTGDIPELTVAVSCAPAPGKVNALYFDIVTGSDDLKGDSFNALAPGPDGNNLDVIIGFSNGSNQHAPNVNGGANWANNTEHKFWVYLSQPVDLTEIKSITLQTVLQRFGGDKWNMDSVQVTAVGNGVNKLIATHGFYRFNENASLDLDMVSQ